jgi:hypothetical protein
MATCPAMGRKGPAMPKLPPPTKLGAKARKVWADITDTYTLRPDELRVLEDACREIDLVERLEKELSKPGVSMIVKGSMGQPVANPLMAEVRQHRQTVKALFAAIALPDDDSRLAGARSSAARQAANARWRRGA